MKITVYFVSPYPIITAKVPTASSQEGVLAKYNATDVPPFNSF